MNQEEARERHSYIIGLVLAVVLSAIPFGLLMAGTLSRGAFLWCVALCAVVQVVAHFRYFLHIDLQRSHRDDLQLILFSTLIVLLMVGGTLWVIGNEKAMMM
ncbi:cytochrome o ubiquinol oxidase subunit IV [Neoasaia chiangmaiensis NBRC 101099]|uniref:Cytochrome bo(3) ubiquinol oxidase subunit 4 n=1 Tax=Neoasaia chiangmaiensis TaxID=320497 RepID=A0A1U9KSM0_9PROT|nr:cytochrome o ubiquinol oxidase subunit IV [Neoasaia chiangmaiensis]AQS88826.1 cytochrome-c oxidase [Neoasaia chiangmaiensis]GBR40677.1 cytochrome o ubiquinol oxidase subunit IV [Neoasaia chiangmaiensis NBRC 101099]GEN13792.1 cytochrome o ubiquinol oxidase subunit IV [Neoasaia chiangmaiensis]